MRQGVEMIVVGYVASHGIWPRRNERQVLKSRAYSWDWASGTVSNRGLNDTTRELLSGKAAQKLQPDS